MNRKDLLSIQHNARELIELANKQIENYTELIESTEKRVYTMILDSDDRYAGFNRFTPWRPKGSKQGSEWFIHQDMHCPLRFDDEGNITHVCLNKHATIIPIKPKWVSIDEYEPVVLKSREMLNDILSSS